MFHEDHNFNYPAESKADEHKKTLNETILVTIWCNWIFSTYTFLTVFHENDALYHSAMN